VLIDSVQTRVYRIPTATPESDGTLAWDSTTLVYVEVRAGDRTGIGYTYADLGTAAVIDEMLAKTIVGKNALETSARWMDMEHAFRNLGRDGITSMALSAVDVALWDLKGKVFGQPVCALLGMARSEVPVYGSGGFTSYSIAQLQEQLGGWVADGIPRVKMKVGRDDAADAARVAAARESIGPDAELFVDANGGYSRKGALAQAERFAEQRVTWFEEPVFREDYEGTRMVRERAPAGMEISSGEYGYGLYQFQRMLEQKTVDVLQADATRCGGFSGLLAVDGLCQAWMMPLSTHCAPYLHIHAAAALKQLRHIEYFFDHARIERMLFDGPPAPAKGALVPDLSRPGIGLELKKADAEAYAVA
jgi:L-alanine-DL-glutamate epimerase-like enolase superfamily enzyme